MIDYSIEKNHTSIDIHIHFYFNDENVHSMNAQILNECERQFIKAVNNANNYLLEPLEIKICAKEKGGLLEVFQFLNDNPTVTNYVFLVISNICTAFFTSKMHNKLSVEEQSKLRLENILATKEAIASGKITEEEFKLIAGSDKTLLKSRSDFFKTAKKEKTLKNIDIETNTKIADKYLFEKISVTYEQFDDFIMIDEGEEEQEIKEDKVRIYIISPILVKGIKPHWRGLYNGISIDFHISDKDFLELIYTKEINFTNGTFIDCILRTTKIIKNNNESITREVFLVEEYGNDESITIQFSRKLNKTKDEGQNLFSFSEDNIE